MNSGPQPPSLNPFTIAIIWIVLLAGLSFFFDDLLEGMDNPNRKVTVGSSVDGGSTVVLKQNRQGHYVANGEINGYPVKFLLDTGATLVAIPEHIAERIGLERGAPHQTMTANGTSTSYMTRLDSASLGAITLNNVPASISSGMKFDEILLGMSFLKHLTLNQQNRQLILSIPESDF